MSGSDANPEKSNLQPQSVPEPIVVEKKDPIPTAPVAVKEQPKQENQSIAAAPKIETKETLPVPKAPSQRPKINFSGVTSNKKASLLVTRVKEEELMSSFESEIIGSDWSNAKK